jgi:C-terminal processing protease CtpA/Prc
MAFASAPASAQNAPAAPGAARGWVGISYTEVSSGRAGAVVVHSVAENSPADDGGLEVGDTITLWNGQSDVPAAVLETRLRPGDKVRLRLRRDGRTRDLNLVADERPTRLVEVIQGSDDGEVIILNPSRIAAQIRIHADSMSIHADSLVHRLRVMYRDSLAPQLRAFEREMPRIRIEMDRARGEAVRARAEVARARSEMNREQLEQHLERAQAGHERAAVYAPARTLAPLSWARGVAGAEITEVNPGLGSYFGTDVGALVLRVSPETPASRAGLEAGDVIVSANGAPVEDVNDLRRLVSRADDGDVELVVIRKGARRELRLRWE